jgi:hypothetical protein
MALYMHAKSVSAELETILHIVLLVNDGASTLSMLVVVVSAVGAAWMALAR